MAYAVRLLDGHMLPFVDAVDHRAPLPFWLTAAAALVTGRFSWGAVRLCGMLSATIAVTSLFGLGRVSQRRLAGALAAIGFVAGLILLGPNDGLAFNGELLLDSLAMPALWCLAVAFREGSERRATWLVPIAGVLAGLSILAKQVGVVVAPTLAVWVVITSMSRPAFYGLRIRLICSFGLGVALPVLLVVAVYALAGQTEALCYWSVVRPLTIYMAPYTPAARSAAHVAWFQAHRQALVVLAALVLWALGLPLVVWRKARPMSSRGAAALGLPAALDRCALPLVVATGSVASTWMAHALLREFGHYYVQPLPWVALLAGLFCESIVSGMARGPRTKVALYALAVVVPLIALTSQLMQRAPRYDRRERERWAVCGYIQAHSAATDPLFIWGYRPDLYIACQRRPASRFVHTPMVAGFVEGFDAPPEKEAGWVAPHAQETLISDLEQSHPPIIVDLGITMHGRKLDRYPQVFNYVNRDYCRAATDGQADYYLRRDLGACRAGAPERLYLWHTVPR